MSFLCVSDSDLVASLPERIVSKVVPHRLKWTSGTGPEPKRYFTGSIDLMLFVSDC